MQKELLLRKLDILKNSYKEVRKKGNSPEAKAIHVEIEQLVKDIEEAETEELIQKAKEAGILPRLERIISMIQLLSCEANDLLSEAEDSFKKAGLMTDKIVYMQREYYKAANVYFKEFSGIIKKTNTGDDMFSDLENFDNMIRIWADLKERPKPKSLMGGCKVAAGKANGLSQMCQKCALTYNPETLICQACDKSFKEGFQKGAKWLEKKRIDRIMNKDKECKMITENDPILPRKVDLEKNPSGTELKIAQHRELEKHGRYVAIPGDKSHTRIFVRNGEDTGKKIAAYLERINNRPQRWN